MTSPTTRRETLRHNPLNAVTVVVERVTDAAGATRVRKELRRTSHAPDSTENAWAASTDPHHWNYWRREADAYLSGPLRQSLQDAGLDMPRAEIAEHEEGVTLWLEDVAGTPGTAFTLTDHAALAESVGRWQAHGPMPAPWASRGFLRDYASSRPAAWELVDDVASWRQPLIRDTWPAGLREGWHRLLEHRQQLLAVMAGLARTRSHLDLWVSNEIRRPTGENVLLDWAFTGDGAIGEDIGNHVPDAVFDLFWPAERLAELDAACFEAYLSGLRQAGWRGRDSDARLGVVASCVKYAWLLPRMLERAGAVSHNAYHRTADADHLYHQRGLALSHLVDWCDEAVRLIG